MAAVSPPIFQKDLSDFRREMNRKFDGVDKRFDKMEKRFDDMDKKFDVMSDNFFKWKIEIHDLIDTGFTGKARKLDEESDILNIRTSDLRERVEKLESAVFKN